MKHAASFIILVLAALLPLKVHAQSTPFSYGYPGSAGSGGSGSTSPGGTVTGANQYRSASGTFAGDDMIIDNGAGMLSMSTLSSSLVMTGIGSNTDPGFSFVLDPDTGMYRSAANELAFTTGGTRRMAINQTGIGIMTSLVIGTNVPQSISALNVSGTVLMTGQGVACTSANLGAIRYSSTTTSIAACLNPSGTPNWYALASATVVVSATQP